VASPFLFGEGLLFFRGDVLTDILTLALIGAVGGFLSGLLGIGGGVILIPLLVYAGHISMMVATSVSMVVIIFASLSGALAHLRRKSVHAKTGIWMGLASVSSAIGASFLSKRLPEDFLYFLYMGLVAGAAAVLLLPRSEDRAMVREYDFRKSLTVCVGVFQGFLTGVLGIGGGFLVVPLMIYVLGMATHKAIGTSLVVILFSAGAAFLGRVVTGDFGFRIVFWVVLGTIPTTQVGAWAAHKSSPRLVRSFLMILLIGILAWMVRAVLMS
jgi:hypothetical protein